LRLAGGLWETNDIRHCLHNFLAGSTFIFFNFQASLSGPSLLPLKQEMPGYTETTGQEVQKLLTLWKSLVQTSSVTCRKHGTRSLTHKMLADPPSELPAHSAGCFCSDQV